MSLYVPELYEMIVHLRKEVRQSASVSLVTSNPDFVIIRSSLLDSSVIRQPINAPTASDIHFLDNLFNNFRSICEFGDIRAYCSVKYSLRPDRRLQIPHEGSLIKALHVHLQTRKWIINCDPIKYYAASRSLGPSDVEALKTVATHSITNVNSIPQPAVDEVFSLPTLSHAKAMFEQILKT
jgi:hypothetical protein